MKLKRVLLNNWLYYHHEIVYFDDINLLTGKTGQGKSAFLDALNIVLYGEIKSWNFNKAANDKSNRSILSYLKGKFKDKGFLRDNGIFNTYIVLEFEDELGKCFCQGIVFEVDGQSDARRDAFFTLNSAIPEHEFLKEDNLSYTIKDLRSYIKETQDEKSKLFDRNEDYQADLRLKIGIRDTRQFVKISKKALSYATIDKIDNFIVENICDFDRKVDIEQLLNEMRDYRELAELLKNMKQKKEQLEVIRDIKLRYNDTLHALITSQAEKALCEYQLLMLRKKEIITKKEDLAKQQEKQAILISELAVKKETAETAYMELYSLYTNSANTDLEQRIRSITKQCQSVNEKLAATTKKMMHALTQMDEKLSQLDELLDVDLLDEQGLSLIDLQLVLRKALNRLQTKQPCMSEEEQQDLFQKLALVEELFYDAQSEYKTTQNSIIKQIQESQTTIQNYKKGMKNYPSELLNLKKTIEDALEQKYQKKIDIHILADVMEVSNPVWANAVEGFLGKRKFNLIVEPQYFQDAYQLYKYDRQLKQIYDYSIVDVESIQARKAMGVPTLYDCVTSQNTYADVYLQYMLAGVVLCEDDTKIKAYPVSITKDCMLYQAYSVRRIHEKQWRNHYIGGNAIEALLAQEEQQLHTLEVSLKDIASRKASLDDNKLEASGVLDMLINSYHQECDNSINVQKDLEQLQQQKQLLDTDEIDELKKRLASSKKEKETMETQYHKACAKQENDKAKLQVLNEEYAQSYTLCEQFEEKHKQDINFDELPEIMESFSEIKTKLQTLTLGIERLTKESITIESKLLNLKKDYNRTFQMSLQEYMESDDFDREYLKYPGHDILNYEERFKDKERVAKETFENSFLGSLKKRIDGTKSAIDDLNTNICMIPFGHSKYRFKMEPKKEYEEIYHVIMSDELNGRSLWNTKTYEENQSILDELFNQISEYSTTTDYYVKEQLKARVENLSDYTTYLEFDITDNGESLKKSITDKSGGETQTPFYIAILASLMNCYRNKQEDKLVLLDEAFDKMDSERIKECIHLLRILKFQAIVVTTNDKIINLGAIVDSVKVAKTKQTTNGKKASMIMNFFKENV